MLNLRQFNPADAQSAVSGSATTRSVVFRLPPSVLGNISEPLQHGTETDDRDESGYGFEETYHTSEVSSEYKARRAREPDEVLPAAIAEVGAPLEGWS